METGVSPFMVMGNMGGEKSGRKHAVIDYPHILYSEKSGVLYPVAANPYKTEALSIYLWVLCKYVK